METSPADIVKKIIPHPFRAGTSTAAAALTCRVSAAEPLMPREDVRFPVVLLYVPGATTVTLTDTVHELPAATVPPE
jgi:hypothetical protein